MKKVIFSCIFLVLPAVAFAQVTRVSQLGDVKESDVFYADLKSLVEDYGAIGNDLIVVAADTVPAPKNPSIGDKFYPLTKLTNRQLAFILEDTFGQLDKMTGRLELPDGLDEIGKFRFFKEIQALRNKEPLNKMAFASYKDLKGFSYRFEEAESLRVLIETHGIGRDLADAGPSYNRTKTYSEKAISDILGNALRVKPVCLKTACKIGNLTLDYKNKIVNRGRFARILNQYLSEFVKKADKVINGFSAAEKS